MDPLLKLAQLYNTYLCGEKNTRKFDIGKEIDIDYCIPDDIAINKQDANYAGYNCLHIAAMMYDVDMVEYFLSEGADLFKQGTLDGCTPVHLVINNYCELWQQTYRTFTGFLRPNKSLNSLLTAHVKTKNALNPKCNDGISHLHVACMVNHVETVEFFLKNGEPLDHVTNADSHWPGYTPLHFAVRYSSVQAAELLLKHGADIYREDAKGLSSLHFAVKRLISTHDYIFMARGAVGYPYTEEIQRIDKLLCLMLKNMSQKEDSDTSVQNSGQASFYLACMIEEPSFLDNFLKTTVDLNVAVDSNFQFWPGWTPLHFAACISHERFKLLLEHGADIGVKNIEGETPLDFLMKRFSLETVHSILSTKQELADITLSDDRTKLGNLISAMSQIDTFDAFLQSLETVNISVPFDSPIWPGFTILHLALTSNYKFELCKEFHELTEFGKNPFVCIRKDSSTVNIEYWDTRNWDLIEKCLASGCRVTTENANGETPIHKAFNLRNEGLVKKLLKYCESDVVNCNNLSIFHIACVVDDVELARHLLTKKSDVNLAVNSEFQWYDVECGDDEERIVSVITIEANSTALHMAVSLQHEGIIELLASNGANVYATDSNGSTPLHLSISSSRENNAKIVALLLSKIPKLRNWVNTDGLSHVHVAAFANDDKALKKLVKNGVNISIVASSPERFAGQTPLHLAACFDFSKVVKALIGAGADIRLENPLKKYETPLLYAVNRLSARTIKYFVEKLKLEDCGVGSVDFSGLTLLHLACAASDLKLAKELLEKGADPNAQIRTDFDFELAGFTPLHVVVSHIKPRQPLPERLAELVELLLDYGADVTIRSNGRGSPVHMVYGSAFSRYEKPSVDTITPYRNVVDMMLRRQISYDVNPLDNSEGKCGFSHFHLACVQNNVDVVERFLQCGVDINHRTDPMSSGGENGLHFAIKYHCLDVARLLIERGADVNAENAMGNGALHTSMLHSFADVNFMKLLLSHEADIKAVNCANETPLLCLIHSSGLTFERLKFFLSRGCKIDTNDMRWQRQGVLGLALAGVPQCELASILKTLIKVCKLRSTIKKGFNAIYNVAEIENRSGTFTFDAYLYTILRFIDMGCDIDQREGREVAEGCNIEQWLAGDTALHVAMNYQNFEAVSALLLLGADINVTNLNNETPLGKYSKGRYCDENNPLSVELVKLFAAHVWKMKLVGFNLHQSNAVNAEAIHEIFPLNLDIELSCQKELTKMEGVEIDRKLSVKHFLVGSTIITGYITMPLAKREAICNFFKDSSKLIAKFPEFGGLLIMKHRKIQNRLKMWDEAKDALISVSQFQLPDLCIEAVFQFLSNEELKNLISTAETEKTAILSLDCLNLQD